MEELLLAAIEDLRKEQLEIKGMLLEIRREQRGKSKESIEQENPLTIDQATQILHISKGAIYQKIDKIPHRKRGKRLYFFRNELTEYLNKGTA